MKEWKQIRGFEHYQISNDGEVMNPNGRILKPFLGGSGYLSIGLFREDCKTKRYVHRLVAEAFCENPNLHKEVNHKDGNKHNNRADNLEWCSRTENLLHSCYTLNQHVKAVQCIETGVVYPSIRRAVQHTGATKNGIAMCCEGKQKKSNKLHWRYAT